MKKLLFYFLLVMSISLSAAPYNGNPVRFRQPDGTFIEIKLYGDEYYLRAETADGYTLIRDLESGWICYALYSAADQSLKSSGIPYTGGAAKASVIQALKLNPHLDAAPERIRQIQAANREILLGKSTMPPAAPTISGNIKGICIVVDFPDEPGILPITEFGSFCNDMLYSNYGNNGSLRTFYSDISGGVLDYENIVYGYYRAPHSFSYYDQLPYAQGAQELLGQALNWVASQGFDFSTLSTNPDNSIMAINLMYTGYPGAWAQGMWWHMGNYNGFTANGVHSGPYNCSPANSPLELAVVAHENGHMIGKWPDTYKYDNSTGPDGIGAFDLMCWYGDSHNPVPPNPFFRSSAGWGQVTDVTYYNGIIADTAGSLTTYKFRNQNDTSEFFLLENRMKTGRSQMIPDEGLTIWHIDKLGDNQTFHHQVFLEHANNDIWNHDHACFHEGFNEEFSLNTTPDSRWYNNDPSGLRVWDIAAVNPILHYKIGAGIPAPTFTLSWVNISGDNNSNGFAEPGESAFLNVLSGNFGQLASGNATVTCSLIGPPTSWVTLVNTSVTLGILTTGQTLPAAFQIVLDPATPLGTQLQFRFEISDGTYSTYITKTLLIGAQYTMDNQLITSCQALFYDHGGPFGNYANMTDYLMTVYPLSSSQKARVEFLSFDLEESANCIYDWLKIYDGEQVTDPLLGMWCGTNSPGLLNSTDASGALTFEFHSDEGLTGNGWEAVLSCSGSSSVDTYAQGFIRILPNPARNQIVLSSGYSGNTGIRILSAFGQCIRELTCNPAENPVIDLSGNAPGLYLIQIILPDSVLSYKLILE